MADEMMVGNVTANQTATTSAIYYYYYYDDDDDSYQGRTVEYTLSAFGVVLGAISIVLNLAFLLAMQFLQEKCTAYHRLMQNLSFADAMASLTFIITLWPSGPLARIDPSEKFIWSHVLPYVFRSTPWMFFTVYLLTLSVLTVNQYVAVCRPWKYSECTTAKRVCVTLVIIWTVASLQIFVPLVVILALSARKDKEGATEVLYEVSKVEIQTWMGLFTAATVFSAALDVIVYREIKSLKLQRQRSVSAASATDSLNIRMKQQAFVTVFLLLLASIFCRLPFPLMGIVYQNYHLQMDENTHRIVNAFLVLLLYVNFFVDPIIYIARMKEVRRTFLLLGVVCVTCCREGSGRGVTAARLVLRRQPTELSRQTREMRLLSNPGPGIGTAPAAPLTESCI